MCAVGLLMGSGKGLFTGRTLDAAEAERVGLVDQAGEVDAINAAIAEFREQLEPCSDRAVASFKRITHEQRREARDRNLQAEIRESVACVGDDDTRQRLDAFLSRKKG